jgi:hypothetical protein
MFDTLTNKNFTLFAAKYYDNPRCIDTIEFTEDIARIKYLKRLFRNYIESGVKLNHRLILNHFIALYNVFEADACTRMLFFKMYDYIEYMRPFLEYLNYWPQRPVEGIGPKGEIIYPDFIDSDEDIERDLENYE